MLRLVCPRNCAAFSVIISWVRRENRLYKIIPRTTMTIPAIREKDMVIFVCMPVFFIFSLFLS